MKLPTQKYKSYIRALWMSAKIQIIKPKWYEYL